MGIRENLSAVKNSFKNPDCLLIAVSKTKPVEDLKEAYEAGIRDFGENKVQEMADKQPQLPADIRWHMIGHLQRNKVKYIAPFVSLIHAVDSLRLLKEINKQAKRNERVIDCLLQIKIAEEDSKFGMDIADATALLNSEELQNFKNVKIVGLMGMATFTDDEKQISQEFQRLKKVFDQFKIEKSELKILSMGMSGDYKIAIENGSNMVRIGSAIFGERNY